jgi:hypothetical protein
VNSATEKNSVAGHLKKEQYNLPTIRLHLRTKNKFSSRQKRLIEALFEEARQNNFVVRIQFSK